MSPQCVLTNGWHAVLPPDRTGAVQQSGLEISPQEHEQGHCAEHRHPNQQRGLVEGAGPESREQSPSQETQIGDVIGFQAPIGIRSAWALHSAGHTARVGTT